MNPTILDLIRSLFDFVDIAQDTVKSEVGDANDYLHDVSLACDTLDKTIECLDDIKTEDNEILNTLSSIRRDLYDQVDKIRETSSRIASNLETIENDITDTKDLPTYDNFELVCIKEWITI